MQQKTASTQKSETTQDALRVVIYGRNDEIIAEIASEKGNVKSNLNQKAKISGESEIAKYVNIIEATLKLGTGTYTGTIEPAE